MANFEPLWQYHGLGRTEATKMLLDSKKDGAFLVRESESKKGDYVLSLSAEGSVFHYRVIQSENGYCIETAEGTQQEYCGTMEELIEFYTQPRCGFASPLNYPIIRTTAIQKEKDDLADYDYKFNVVLIGDTKVGKTCIVGRYSEDVFYSAFITTRGIECIVQMLDLEEKKMKLEIWDTPGQDLESFNPIFFGHRRRASLKGIVLVYDITNVESFGNIKKWVVDVDEHAITNVEIMILGNKCDMEDERKVSSAEGEMFSAEHRLKFMETSAKTGQGVEEAFHILTREIKAKMDQKLKSRFLPPAPVRFGSRTKKENVKMRENGASKHQYEEVGQSELQATAVRNMTESQIRDMRLLVGDLQRYIYEERREKVRFARENDQLTQEKDAVSRERDQLIQEKDEMIRERDQLIRVKDDIIQERDQVIREKDAVTRERDQLTQEKNEMAQEKDRLVREEDAGIRETEASSTEVTRLRQDVTRLTTLLTNAETAIRIIGQSEKVLHIPSAHINLTGKKLGKGSYGEVRIAYWRGCPVAIKMLYEALTTSQRNIDFLMQEVGIAWKVHHPNIASVCGVTVELEDEKKNAWIVMELLQGSMSAVIDESRRQEVKALTLRERVDVAHDCLCGLNYLHRLPGVILHGDIRPTNMLITVLMTAKLGDLGAARFSDATLSVGLVSPDYTAPERMDGTSPQKSKKTDVYSMGVSVCELFTGLPPSEAERMRHLHLIDQRDVRFLCMAMVSEDPQARPSAAAILTVIDQVCETNEYKTCPPRRMVKGMLDGAETVELIDRVW